MREHALSQQAAPLQCSAYKVYKAGQSHADMAAMRQPCFYMARGLPILLF